MHAPGHPARFPCRVARMACLPPSQRQVLRRLPFRPPVNASKMTCYFFAVSGNMLTFQEIVLRLQNYWNAQGCALLQPYDMEMGAGTFHTATFLRALGPEPWRAAYVQPSRRPKDGRYGENPNTCSTITSIRWC